MLTKDRKDRPFHLVAVELLLREDGSIESIDVNTDPQSGYPPNVWPMRVLLCLADGKTEKAAKTRGVERLRIMCPTWVRYLKSRPGAFVGKGLGGAVQPIKRAKAK